MEERDKKLGNLRQRSVSKSQLRVSVAASTSQYHHQRTFSQDHHHHHLQPNLQTITHPAVIKTKAAAPLNLLSMVHFWSSFFSLSLLLLLLLLLLVMVEEVVEVVWVGVGTVNTRTH